MEGDATMQQQAVAVGATCFSAGSPFWFTWILQKENVEAFPVSRQNRVLAHFCLVHSV